ncbi:MAG: DUF933 domain-containing protein [bacterium]
MINTFVFSNNFNLSSYFFKILSSYIKKEYKENLKQVIINIKNENFEKLINYFKPDKITYESILFYTKDIEPLKEISKSDYFILLFDNINDLNNELQKLKQRDLEILSNFLNSKNFKKQNKYLQPDIENIIKIIEQDQLELEKFIYYNTHLEELITSLALSYLKKSLFIIDSKTDKIESDLTKANLFRTLFIPISIIAELIDLKDLEFIQFFKEFELNYLIPIENLNSLTQEKLVNFIVNLILDNILKYWVIFYTGNKKEVKAYLITRGKTVLDASYKIHTEIGKNFISALVCNINDLKDSKFPLYQNYGKSYIVQDHDYLSIKTNS